MPGCSRLASVCMSATSSRTRATTKGQTFSRKLWATAGSTAIVSCMRQCAWLLKPSSLARSARSLTMAVMMALVSLASSLSPRLLNFFQTISRRCRRVENVRNGSTLDRVFTMAHDPARPRSSAAVFAAAATDAGSPSRSDSRSSTIHVFSSASTLARNSANRAASSWLMADRRVF